MRVLILALVLPLADACVGGYRGVPPKGHPNVASTGSDVYPCAGTSLCKKALRDYGGIFNPSGPWDPSQNVSMRFLNKAAKLSTTLKKDLCYWSMQTLPAPPNILGLHHITEFDAPRVMDIYGELATSRLQEKMATVSSIQFVGCSYGYELRQAQCKYGQNTSVSCSPAANKQEIKWPVSSVMLKINKDTIDEIAHAIYTWRTTEAGHWPNMHAGAKNGSGAYQWGYQGGLFAKIVPCEDIPKDIIKQSHACDEVDPKTGKLHADYWWEAWGKLCNVYEDSLIPSTLESCAKEEPLVV